jgi:predicted ABC-type ATPase
MEPSILDSIEDLSDNARNVLCTSSDDIGKFCLENGLQFNRVTNEATIDIKHYDFMFNSVFKNISPVERHFIITYGPPASGKSSVNKLLFDNDTYNIPSKTVSFINVDNIIQLHPDYVRSREILINSNASHEELSRLYDLYRSKADIISDRLLDKALLDGYNIIWETTGQYITWTVKEIERIKRHGYKIWLAYPLVSRAGLKKRLEKRKIEQQSVQNIDVYIKAAGANLITLVDFVDRLILIDNTGDINSEYILLDIIRNYVGDWKYGKLGIKIECPICKIKKYGFEQELRDILSDKTFDYLESICNC